MKGWLAHLALTLRLNFRARQALVYGYLVPLFFLLAFGSVFHSSLPPLLHEMGQLITITVLGGACFGMPTAVVAERERGVWRRYRLLPGSTAGLLVSTMLARYLIVLSAALMQFGLAWSLYRTPFPADPWGELVAFSAVSFSFLGMGLVVAMACNTVPAVQALGQAIFLPMIMIGGVGVPLRVLPSWAQHVAGFLPGRYAVEALDACYLPGGPGLAGARFPLAALLVIGAAACLAGWRMFRWDSGQGRPRGASPWMAFALAAWAAVGLSAEQSGRLAAGPGPAPLPGNWRQVTDAQVHAIRFDDLPPDSGIVTPLAANLDNLPAESRARVQGLQDRLAHWPPAAAADPVQRLRNLLSVAALFDVLQDPDESSLALLVLENIAGQLPADELAQVLVFLIEHPYDGSVLTEASELGVDGSILEAAARERVLLYALKLLKRTRGK